VWLRAWLLDGFEDQAGAASRAVIDLDACSTGANSAPPKTIAARALGLRKGVSQGSGPPILLAERYRLRSTRTLKQSSDSDKLQRPPGHRPALADLPFAMELSMPGRLQFDFSPQAGRAPRDGRGALRVLVLGDFSARPAAERPPLAQRPTHRVDVDNLDSQLRRLAPRVVHPAGGLQFEGLDDFHPDALFARLPVFASLRQMRQRLLDPALFVQAAAELGRAPPAGSTGSGSADAGAELLAGLLGGRPATAPAVAVAPATGIDALIRNIVAPHILPDHRAQQTALVTSVDQAIAAEMRGVLHEPAFQALESAWRGVQWLIANLELDETLELHLLDVSKTELLADVVGAAGQSGQTGLQQALANRGRLEAGDSGWSVLCGLYSFGPTATDIGLLAALGLIARQAGAPFLAAGDTALALADAATLTGWQTLRHSEAARWLGLAAPRVLLRQPYGQRSDPCTAFAFEEFPGAPDHEHFLWGAGSLAATLLIGRAYTAKGWGFEPGDERDIGDLPAYHCLRDGEREMQACAEDFLSEQAGLALLRAGLMPVLSHRHRNAVTVMRFQSVAEPPSGLAGLTPR
jgi:predicted component of type VI protein secretion system